jgi:hypothetical protein
MQLSAERILVVPILDVILPLNSSEQSEPEVLHVHDNRLIKGYI